MRMNKQLLLLSGFVPLLLLQNPPTPLLYPSGSISLEGYNQACASAGNCGFTTPFGEGGEGGGACNISSMSKHYVLSQSGGNLESTDATDYSELDKPVLDQNGNTIGLASAQDVSVATGKVSATTSRININFEYYSYKKREGEIYSQNCPQPPGVGLACANTFSETQQTVTVPFTVTGSSSANMTVRAQLPTFDGCDMGLANNTTDDGLQAAMSVSIQSASQSYFSWVAEIGNSQSCNQAVTLPPGNYTLTAFYKRTRFGTTQASCSTGAQSVDCADIKEKPYVKFYVTP